MDDAMALKPKKSDKSTTESKSKAERATGKEASRLIDERIQSLGGWRAETLAEVRRLIHEADPDILEEWKWMGTPVWSHAGNICTGEVYKQTVKLTQAAVAARERGSRAPLLVAVDLTSDRPEGGQNDESM
jgi:hypothetical protein